VPARPEEPVVGRVRGWTRLAVAGVVLVAAVPIVPVFPLLARRARAAVLSRWCRAVLAAFGVRLRVIDAAPGGAAGGRDAGAGGGTAVGALLVANHVSWLDVVAIDAVRPGRMVAKEEMRSWPVVGRLATGAGTVYIDRERLSTLPVTVADVAAALRAGDTVTMFPEGTTWCGGRGGRFRATAFQAAIDARAPVVPVALRFVGPGGVATATPAFVGDHTLWTVLRRTARLRGLTVEVHLLPALFPPPPGAGPAQPARAVLARAAERAVAAV
jgi:1-acyl-sn-glycerol-3-phosphate acyltransferase